MGACAVGGFASTTASGLDDGTIAPAAARSFDDAMDRLVMAMAIALPSTGSHHQPPSTDPKPDPGHGPPDHANGNAYGNEGED